jgi:hypothetical protein
MGAQQTICLLPASGIIILNHCDQVSNYFLHYFQNFQEMMSVLPQITYDNLALVFLSYFHGYNKNYIFADYWDT